MKAYFTNRFALFRQKSFRHYFMSCMFSTLGFGVSYIGTTWLMLSLGHTLTALIWGFLAYWVPNALCSPLAGVLVDRYDRKKIIAYGNMLCALTYITLGVFLFFHPKIDIYWVYLAWCIVGVMQGLYNPALMSFIREVVSKEDLLYANANVDLGYQIGWVFGAGCAGILIHWLGFSISYWISGSLLIASGWAMLLVERKPGYRRAMEVEGNIASASDYVPAKRNVFRQVFLDFKSGMGYLFSHRQALVVYFAQLFFILIFMTAPVLLVPFAKDILHANVAAFGQIEATLTIGTVLGGLLLTYLVDRLGFSRIVLTANAILVISLFAFSMVSTLSSAMWAYFFIGFSLGCWPLLMTKAQEITDLAYQGRVQSVFSCLLALAIILLYLVIHLASEFITIRHIYWIVGFVGLGPAGLIIAFPKYFKRDCVIT